MLKITGGRVLTDGGIVSANVYIENGRIAKIDDRDIPCDEVIDAEGCYVSPGFIDTHVHGGAGFDFNCRDEESVYSALKVHLDHGTTTILPTVCSCPMSVIPEVADTVRRVASRADVPYIPGLHLEGPYLNVSQAGGIAPQYLTSPKAEEYLPIFDKCGDYIKKVTFAPELEGAMELFLCLKNKGIVASAGHTEADLEDIARFREQGLNMVTHLYSSMSGITRRQGYRILGVIEAAYYFDDIYAEVICDGIHLPPKLLELIYRIKGSDRICLITDAIRAAELQVSEKDADYIEREFGMIIEDGIAKMPHRQCFAGSLATTDRLIRVMRPIAGLENAVKMLTKIPAVSHNLCGKGVIGEGYDADIVIFDEDINIKKIIMKKGEKAFIYK